MARYAYQGHAADANGAVIPSAVISVFLTGGSTAASIYTASSGGSAVNSVTADATTGFFIFYVDNGDYQTSQLFKLTITKAGHAPQTYNDVTIFTRGVELTTKGDLLTRTSTLDIRLPVGTNGQILVADSASTGGLKWDNKIVDSSGNTIVSFGSNADAVNFIYIGNRATGSGPLIQALGTDTNINLDLVTKGSGVVRANGYVVIDTTSTQTLSNKTLTTPKISGLIDATTWPSFSAHKNAVDQTGLADSTWTKVTFSTERFDTNNNFASSTFTPTAAGKYLLTAAVFISTQLNAAGLMEVGIYKNGSIIHKIIISVDIAWSQGTSISAVVEANGTTDYFEIYVFQTGGGTETISGTIEETWFTGCRIG